MITYIKNWLVARRRRLEREAFARGRAWARYALTSGEYNAEALLAVSEPSFDKDYTANAFDRGVVSVADDALSRHGENLYDRSH